MKRNDRLIKLIKSGKFNTQYIAKLVKASGGNSYVVTAALEAVKNFEGMDAKKIVEFIEASGGDRRVILAAIETDKVL